MAWGVPKIGTSVIDATGNFNLIEPASVAQGDLMVACIAMRGTAVVSLSGWTAAATQQNSGDTDTIDGIASGAMFYVVRGASAPNLTVTRTAGDVAYAKIISYSGVSLTAPYDTGTSATQGSAGNTPTTATFNTALDNELIIAMVAYGDQYTVSAFDAATNPATASGATDTTTAPTAGTWIERFDANSNTGADTGIGIADAIRATAGATGTIQATVSSASGRNVMMAAAFKMEVSPTTVLNTPADTATGIAVDPTFDFTGTDENSNDIRYNIQIDSSSSFDSTVLLSDSYSESNQNSETNIASGTTTSYGQSFTPLSSGALDSISFYLKNNGSPTGNATAKLYAHSGTYGTSSVPTGAALATSDVFDVSTLTASFQLITFNFTGGNRYSIDSSLKYVIAFEFTGGTNPTATVRIGLDSSSPTHSGNGASFSGSWAASSNDLPFYLYTSGALLNKISGTDAGFDDPDSADTDPFTSGVNITYAVQAGEELDNSTVYYWRVRGLDPSGSNTYGAFATTRSFTTAASAGGAVTPPLPTLLMMGVG